MKKYVLLVILSIIGITACENSKKIETTLKTDKGAKKMRKTITTTLAILMLMASVAIAQSGPRSSGLCSGDGPHGFGHHGMMGQRGDMLLQAADKIGLSEEQIEKIQNLQIAHSLAMVDKKAELEKAQIKLRVLRRDNESLDKVNVAIDNFNRLKAGIQKTKYAHQQEVHGLLTEEQLDKLKEFRQSHMGKRNFDGNQGGRHGGNCGGKRAGNRG